MKSLSAAVVVLAGMVAFTGGGFIGHGDTQAIVMLAGGVVAGVGLLRWFFDRPADAASSDSRGPLP